MTLAHSPLDDVHRSLGAKLVPFGGWDMPLSYPLGTLAEHRACRTGATVFDASVYFLPYVPARIEWSEVAIVSIFTLSVSILVTLWPSWWASRIDPVEALRYE